ncbi:Ger(x)C family spore germination protein [Desmospora profundinema]|uniref:Spore germination protein n=1 Tax=Desmospora profundinema TaxID=1571184 RepID=A0ABU1IN47_9BACL|nr:Ger(x)C family spore germination protein [Desmospora profundinema]MDR6226204.1 spore germination protein [Desmospora profundinema]
MEINLWRKGLILVIAVTLLTGCWDRREINELAFVMGLGIDQVKVDEKTRFRVTHQILEQQNQPQDPQGGGGGGGGARTFENIASQSDTMLQASREVATLWNRTPFFQYVRVVVISDAIARTVPLDELLNLYVRSPEVRRSVKVFITRGEAKAVLEGGRKQEEVPSIALDEMIEENRKKSLSLGVEPALGEAVKAMNQKRDFVLPRVNIHRGTHQMEGGAVIDGETKKQVGWLNREEMDGYGLLSGEAEGGQVVVRPPNTAAPIVYEVQGVKPTKLIPRIKGSRLSFVAMVNVEGRLIENWIKGNDTFEEEMIDQLEDAVEIEVRRLVAQTIRKSKMLQTDIAGFGNQLRIHSIETWKKEEKEWKKRYSEIPIEVQVKAKIKEFGSKGILK